MKVIGFIGPIGAGKDLASSYLGKTRGFRTVNMGDIVREIAAKNNVKPTRENLHRIQRAYTERFGRDFFAQETAKRVQKQWHVNKDLSMEIRAVINGMRRPEDVKVPKQRFGREMVVIYIDAEPNVRFERLKSRGKERDPRTFESFTEQESAEKALFDIEGLAIFADEKITNNGAPEELYAQLDRILAQRGFIRSVFTDVPKPPIKLIAVG